LALGFAQSIFKLDRSGHQEFARYWREVFNALFKMPDLLWNVSRAFNHHVAISRRRVAMDDQLFPDKTQDEKRRLLEDAVDELEYALSISGDDVDEGDLNLYNSLALACQNLASFLELLQVESARVASLRARELECLHQAELLNPSNSFVLETAARSLLSRAKAEPQLTAENSCAALQKLATARRLDSAEGRRRDLDRLTAQAYELLASLSQADLSALKTSNPAVSAMVAAWLLLRDESAAGQVLITDKPSSKVIDAITQLEAIAANARDWPLNRLLYDLIAIQYPSDFERQLRTLQAVDGTPAMQLQLRLERSILLFQTGAFERGKREFDDVRYALKTSEAIIDVPRRLAWYLKPGTSERAICDGRIVRPPPSWNKHAMEVSQLGNSVVVCDPLDFGHATLPIGNQRKCVVGFNYRGPYAVPPIGGNK